MVEDGGAHRRTRRGDMTAHIGAPQLSMLQRADELYTFQQYLEAITFRMRAPDAPSQLFAFQMQLVVTQCVVLWRRPRAGGGLNFLEALLER